MSKHKKYNFFFLCNIRMEHTTSNNSIKAIKEVRKLFNELKNKYNKEEIEKIREELHKKEVIYNFFKGKRARKQFNK